MQFSVWFYPSDETFHTKYDQCCHFRNKPGYINANGHILVASFYSYDNKVFFSTEELEKYVEKQILQKKSFKYRLLKQINAYLDKEDNER